MLIRHYSEHYVSDRIGLLSKQQRPARGYFIIDMEPGNEDNIEYEDIHRYHKKIESILRNIGNYQDAKVCKAFLNKLKLDGKSEGWIFYYADRIPQLLRLFEKQRMQLKDAVKENCEHVLTEIMSKNYKGETIKAYALTLQRLVNFAKTGDIGDKETGYTCEVAWIKPSK